MPLGHRTTYERSDIFGNVGNVVEPGGGAWRYGDDALMRLVATIDPLGSRWKSALRRQRHAGCEMRARRETGRRRWWTKSACVVACGDGGTRDHPRTRRVRCVIAQTAPGRDRPARRAGTAVVAARASRTARGAVTRIEYRTAAGRIARISAYLPAAPNRMSATPAAASAAAVDGAGRRTELRYDADGGLAERRLPDGTVEARRVRRGRARGGADRRPVRGDDLLLRRRRPGCSRHRPRGPAHGASSTTRPAASPRRSTPTAP